MMQKVTGMGCALTGCLAPSYVSFEDKSSALISMLKHYGEAADRAVTKSVGPGTFIEHFLDELSC